MAILIPTTITVMLTDAQVKALPTTLVEIVPAPGAGKTIILLHSIVTCHADDGGYTNTNENQRLYFALGDSDVRQGLPVRNTAGDLTALDDLLTHPDSKTAIIPAYFNIGSLAGIGSADVNTTSTFSQALNLFISDPGSGNLLSGHANNTMTVTVCFYVADLA